MIVLYQIEVTGDSPEQVLESNRRALAERNGLPEYAVELVNLVLEHQEELDGIISRYAEHWSVQRMPIVDRNVLRMGLAELLYRDDIPASVTINECVELAKELSNPDESGRFVNGILGRFWEERSAECG